MWRKLPTRQGDNTGIAAMTDLEVFRMLARDKASAFFTDTEAQWFIDNSPDGIRCAAAAALDNMSTDAAKVAKAMNSSLYGTDLSAIPGALRAAAAALRQEQVLVDSGLPGEAFSGVVESPIFPWETFEGDTEDA